MEWMRILERAGYECIGMTWLPAHHPILVMKSLGRLLSHQFLIAARVLKT